MLHGMYVFILFSYSNTSHSIGRIPSPTHPGPWQTADLASANASEEDKVKAMMTQSSKDFDPSRYYSNQCIPNFITYNICTRTFNNWCTYEKIYIIHEKFGTNKEKLELKKILD